MMSDAATHDSDNGPKEFRLELSSQFEYDIFYEDTDFTGFVYHANYLKYFSRSREQTIGLEMLGEFYQHKLHFVVAHADIRYRLPARHGDRLRVVSNTVITVAPSHLYEHLAYVGENLIAEAKIKIVCVGENDRPQRVDPSLVNSFRSKINPEFIKSLEFK